LKDIITNFPKYISIFPLLFTLVKYRRYTSQADYGDTKIQDLKVHTMILVSCVTMSWLHGAKIM